MTSKQVRLSELKKALDEIGPLEPWWSEEDGMFIFEHDSYPMVMYADEDKDKAIEGYKKALQEFIDERLQGNIPDYVERATSGRGGYREGSGRPKNNEEKVRKYIPVDIAKWLDLDENIEKVRSLMQA